MLPNPELSYHLSLQSAAEPAVQRHPRWVLRRVGEPHPEQVDEDWAIDRNEALTTQGFEMAALQPWQILWGISELSQMPPDVDSAPSQLGFEQKHTIPVCRDRCATHVLVLGSGRRHVV